MRPDRRDAMGDERRQRGLMSTVLIAAVAAAAALFAWRGPWRALHGGSGDSALIYSSARAWLVGANPYDAADTGRVWLEAGGSAEASPAGRGSNVLLYPPPTFALLTPLSVLPWSMAGPAWAGMNAALWVLALRACAGIAGLRFSTAAGRAYWAIGLALAPASTCVAHGQAAIAAVALVAVGQWLRVRAGAAPGGAARWGVLLGLGGVIKPQVAGVFSAYEVGRGRWLAVAASAAVVVGLAIVGIARMEVAGTPWWSSWRANVAAFTLLDDGNPTVTNPLRYQLINLHYALHTMIESREVVRWLVYAIVAGLCAAYWAADRGGARRRGDLGALAMAGVATLLVVYHRSYDATVLVFALAWGVTAASGGAGSPAGRRERRMGIAAVALVCVFLAPGSAVLAEAVKRGHVPAWAAQSAVWRCVVMPHAVWALLGLGVILVMGRWVERAGGEVRAAESRRQA